MKKNVTNTIWQTHKHNFNFSQDVESRHYLSQEQVVKPLECWRLRGCTDEDFYKAKAVNSDTQLYKQAGNAIVVDVLAAIFDSLFN